MVNLRVALSAVLIFTGTKNPVPWSERVTSRRDKLAISFVVLRRAPGRSMPCSECALSPGMPDEEDMADEPVVMGGRWRWVHFSSERHYLGR